MLTPEPYAADDLTPLKRTASDDALWASSIDSAVFSFIVVDLDGTILRWNRAAERLFGWRAPEMLGCSVALTVPEDRRDEFRAAIATVARGEQSAPFETVRRAKDGSDLRVCLQVSPVLDASGALIGASQMGFDCSEQSATRAALIASDARYRALVDALTEFVIVTNPAGEVTAPQPSWTAYTGQDEQDSRGSGWLHAVHPSDRVAFEHRWAQGTTGDEPFSIAARLLHHGDEYHRCEGRVAPMRDLWGRVAEWVTAFSDVQERHVAEERERNTADRFRRIFAANVFGVCYGEHRRILDANDAMLLMLGCRRRELAAGIKLEDFIVGAEINGTAPLGTGEGREFTITRPDGSTAHLLAAGVSLAPDRGWIAVAVDVTQRKAMEREAEQRALHDALTGLANRRLLVDRLQQAMTRADRHGGTVGVLFCDLDHFKSINDRYGHATGDRVLQTVAQRLRALMRESDTVARLGGDEFIVVLEDLASAADAASVADRIRAEVAKAVLHDGDDLHVTCSIGVTTSNGKHTEVEDLLNQADDAMYRAKQAGRNQVAEPAQANESLSNRQWTQRQLERAVSAPALDLTDESATDTPSGRH